MCCQTEGQHGYGTFGGRHVSSCGYGMGPHFLSKKKRIELLNQHLDGLRERAKDIEDYIAELKEGK